MNVGLHLGYGGPAVGDLIPLVARAEAAGVESVWAGEAYGADAVSVLGFLAGRTTRVRLGSGVMQIPARTPATAAMTAMTLDALSGGRFVLGLGMSGPQVVEGWHGMPYGRPLGRTREYVAVVRDAIARDAPLTHDGEHYRIPYRGEDATGAGKALRSILHPVRREIPVHLAAIGPRNVALAAEIAEGWLAFFYSPDRDETFAPHLDAGLARREVAAPLEVAAIVHVAAGGDLADCRDRVRPLIALYAGGMGSRERNFYNDVVRRYGYEEAADRVRDLYIDGKTREAAAAVPDALVDELALVGPLPRIVDRLAAWRASRVDTLILATDDAAAVEAIAAAAV